MVATRIATSRGEPETQAQSSARVDILLAAARVLARGDGSLTVRRVAAEAGITAPTLYSHFRGKDAIVCALKDMVSREFLALLDAPVPRGVSFPQALELLLHRQLELTDRLREAVVAFAQVGRPLDPAPRGRGSTDRFDHYMRRLALWIGRHSRAEERAGRTSAEVAFFYYGVVNGFYLRWLRDGARKRLADRAPLILDLLLGGLAGPVSGRARPVAVGAKGPARARSRRRKSPG